MNPRYPAVADRAAHRCEYCQAPEVIFNFRFEVEHVSPGEGDDDGNLALACRSCNVHKSDRVMCIDPDSGESVVLFNPRTDRWEENFEFDKETGNLVGRSPTGRASANCLQMNSAIHVQARQRWAALGLFL